MGSYVGAHLSRNTIVLRKTDAVAFCPTWLKRIPKTKMCVTNVVRSRFFRDKKAHLSHVFLGPRKHIFSCHFLWIICHIFSNGRISFKNRGSPFYLLSSVIINRLLMLFYEIFNLKPTVELLIHISLIQEIWLAEPIGIHWNIQNPVHDGTMVKAQRQ
jgi:hypothetical protein